MTHLQIALALIGFLSGWFFADVIDMIGKPRGWSIGRMMSIAMCLAIPFNVALTMWLRG